MSNVTDHKNPTQHNGHLHMCMWVCVYVYVCVCEYVRINVWVCVCVIMGHKHMNVSATNRAATASSLTSSVGAAGRLAAASMTSAYAMAIYRCQRMLYLYTLLHKATLSNNECVYEQTTKTKTRVSKQQHERQERQE